MDESRHDTIRLKIDENGKAVRVHPDGREEPYTIPSPDHAELDRLRDADLTARAKADTDNPPLTEADLEAMTTSARVRRIRHVLGLTQAEFARRYRIPVATLRDWEQGRRQPEAAVLAYFTVIARESRIVERALQRA